MKKRLTERSRNTGALSFEPLAKYFLYGIVVIGIGLHVLRLFREPWLDEYGTSWVTSGTWSQLHERANETLPDARLFYIFSWLIQTVLGKTILALRIPSLIISLATFLLVGLMSKKLFGRRAGFYAGIFFLLGTHSPILFEDARPYSLALFSSALCTICLLTWIEKQQRSLALLYGASCAIVIYCHLFFSLIIPCHLLWMLSLYSTVPNSARRELLTQGVIAAVCALVCCVPVLPIILLYSSRAGQLNFLSQPTFLGLLFAAIPLEIFCVLGTVVASLILFRNTPLRKMVANEESPHILGLVLWGVLPTCILGVVGYFLNFPLLLSRYFAHQAIPAALVASWLLDRLSIVLPTRFIVFMPFTLLIAFHSLRVYSDIDEERWQAALLETTKSIQPPCPVLLQPGLVESQQSQLYSNPLWYGYLTQLATYSGLPIKPVLVPYSFVGSSNHQYLKNVITPLIRDNNCLCMVYRSAGMKLVGLEPGESPTPAIFQVSEIVKEFGYSTPLERDYGFVHSAIWQRDSRLQALVASP
jgi:4-amino-4-deoxy-L-arabinose transferase-like glycosyltransferase